MSLTTLGEVMEGVEKMSVNYLDSSVKVDEFEFQDLGNVSIAGERHPVEFPALSLRNWIFLFPLSFDRWRISGVNR